MDPNFSDVYLTIIEHLLRTGIAAAKAGQREQAQDTLRQVVEYDPENIQAWIWLSNVADTLEEQERCLEKILAIDRDHELAQKALRQLKKQKTTQAPPFTELPSPPVSDPEPRQASSHIPTSSTTSEPTLEQPETDQPAKTRLKTGISVAVQQDAASAEPDRSNGRMPQLKDLPDKKPPARQPVSKPKRKIRDLFSNEYLCPYCVAQTKPGDERCGQCNNKLWIKLPRRQNPSKLYRVLLWSHIASNIIYISSILLVLRTALSFQLISSFQTVATFIFCLPTVLYFLGVLLAFHQRWRIYFYLMLVQAVFFLGVTIATAVGLGLSTTPGLVKVLLGGLSILAIAQFFMALNLGEDFTFENYRILLRLDSDIHTGASFLDRGYHYAERGMWALAAMHFRRAISQLTKSVDGHIFLAIAYVNLKQYERAEEPLAKAKALDPTDPRLEKLSKQLAEQRQA